MRDPELDALLPAAEKLVRQHLSGKLCVQKCDIARVLAGCVKPLNGWLGKRIAKTKTEYLIKLLIAHGILRHAWFSTVRSYCVLAPFLKCQHTRFHTKHTT